MSGNGGPAFPHGYEAGYMQATGMSTRDYFAAAALPCAWRIARRASDSGDLNDTGVMISTLIAIAAYNIADAMLAERERTR